VLVGLGVVLCDQDNLSVVFVTAAVRFALVEDLVVVHLLGSFHLLLICKYIDVC